MHTRDTGTAAGRPDQRRLQKREETSWSVHASHLSAHRRVGRGTDIRLYALRTVLVLAPYDLPGGAVNFSSVKAPGT